MQREGQIVAVPAPRRRGTGATKAGVVATIAMTTAARLPIESTDWIRGANASKRTVTTSPATAIAPANAVT